MDATSYATAVVGSPIGELTLVASGRGLRRITFGARDHVGPADDDPVLAATAAQLAAYFAGAATTFDLPLDLGGSTPFQRAVLAAMAAIPYGALRSYGQLAREVGRPGAARAVGRACNDNPVPIVIPCHRVVAADGSLGGYAAGTAVKRMLLERERPAAVPTGGWEPAARRRTGEPDTAPRLFELG